MSDAQPAEKTTPRGVVWILSTAPRCHACRRWSQEDSPDSIGMCAELGRFTFQTFGCVAWEARG